MEELAKQLPAAAAILIVVFAFLGYLKNRAEEAEKRNERLMEFLNERDKRFEELAGTCHAVMEKSIKAIGSNTEVMSRIETEAMGRIEKNLNMAITILQKKKSERRGG